MTDVVTCPEVGIRPAACRKTDISALKAIAQATVNVELFTIPLYMCAMYSIQGMHQITGRCEDFYEGRLWPGPATTATPKTPNEKAFNIIYSVFIEEMLHVQMAANIASSAGVTPTFTSELLQDKDHNWTCYGPDKTTIPHIIKLTDTKSYSDVKVNYDALNQAQIKLFKAIEQPEENARKDVKDPKKYFPCVPFKDWSENHTEKDLPMFGTIGWMYDCYLKYMNLRYDDDPDKTLWQWVYQESAVQRDLFNREEPPGHPVREYSRFSPVVTSDSVHDMWKMLSAITDQGEGSELPRPQLRMVQEDYRASLVALRQDYPSYTDTGGSADSADAAARFCNGGDDHYERFTALEGLLPDVQTWPQWRAGRPQPWTAMDLITTSSCGENRYDLPEPEDIADAMNALGTDNAMYQKISKAAVGSIAGITTVLNDYWAGKDVSFPYPSMVGSGDRMAICWALFRKAPDLSGKLSVQDLLPPPALQHACQGLDLDYDGSHVNDCAAVGIFHSCRGSNRCSTQGGCGFVQKTTGGGGCGFALVKAKTDDDTAPANGRTLYSAPGDNKCGGLGGCAVPISASQVFPRGGEMQLYDFVAVTDKPEEIGTMSFNTGEKVYDVAYRAYEQVMKHREKTAPPRPEPNNLRLAFPPST